MTGTATSATSGTVKTILQIQAPANSKIRIIEWGYIVTATPAAPVQYELLTTDVGATVTSGTVLNYNDSTGPASQCTTGYNASAEGTITDSRLLAQTFDQGTYFKQQFPLGREPEVKQGGFLRIRATPSSAAAATVIAYAIWEE
ncbi:hypothetical protein [Mycobacterium intracellulare]|uniref:hypothetical protein n=1 Tax=Mycobacterium intracellulare TaxID=1767 RepID=UPI001926A1C1|nr:hypothetical protein [Mycobacterium intracellulare]